MLTLSTNEQEHDMTTEQTDANPSTAGNRAEIDRLAERYIGVWSTADATRRGDLGSAVYAENAEFFSSEDGDLRLIGRRNILENIGKVNERDVQGHGLVVRHVGTSVNHRVVKVSWQMATAQGGVALEGVNLLVLDPAGKIAQDYIFIG
jgi:hypothetical protein